MNKCNNEMFRSVKLIDPEGVEWGPYRRMATGLDSINIKTINYGLDNPPPFKKVNTKKDNWYFY